MKRLKHKSETLGLIEVTVPTWLFEAACGNCGNVSDDIPHTNVLADDTSFFATMPCEEYAKLHGCEADYL